MQLFYIGGECTFFTAKSADIKKSFSKTVLLIETLFEECIRSAYFLRYVVYLYYFNNIARKALQREVSLKRMHWKARKIQRPLQVKSSLFPKRDYHFFNIDQSSSSLLSFPVQVSSVVVTTTHKCKCVCLVIP